VGTSARLTPEAVEDRFGKLRFRFVVIADTHVNQEEGRSASPFAVNALANARTRYVIEEVNRLAPPFVIHLGDIVHPVPELPSYAVAARRFKQLAKSLKARLHLVAGNHDVGDKPVAWMPAGNVTEEFVQVYRATFGKDYYSFDANGCHFIIINAQIINSGFDCEREQREWLERDLEENARKRTFVAIHYPPFVSDRQERSNYDNIDEPGRSWLVGLIERHRPEALFCGHVHNFWYHRIGSTECYLLPSTAFVRQDYSELYHVGPGPEEGRNEEEKLGYFVVDVHERGHVAHLVRTYGRQLPPGKKLPKADQLAPVHTKTNVKAALGVDLRHPLVEVIEVAATGGVQEFERKRIRNDYPLMALWEMGVRKMRAPLHDIEDAYLRERIRVLVDVGHQFMFYCFGAPSREARRLLTEHQDLVSGLEVIAPWSDMPETIAALAELKAEARCPIYLSKLRKHEDAQYDGSRFSHFINHGFVLAEGRQLEELFGRDGVRTTVDGAVFRIVRDRSPWEDVTAACALSAELRIHPSFQVRLAADNPAQSLRNDRDTANRIGEAVLTGLAHPGIDLMLDTFDDIDRGYFARNGLVDRRFNPRLAGLVYRHMHAALAPHAPITLESRQVTKNLITCAFSAGGKRHLLLLPRVACRLGELPFAERAGQVRVIDLSDGTIGRATAGARSRGGLTLKNQIRCSHPLLFSL
jgi:3',5'-cyclic AMP phosphodiesterase CpdA